MPTSKSIAPDRSRSIILMISFKSVRLTLIFKDSKSFPSSFTLFVNCKEIFDKQNFQNLFFLNT